MVPPKLAIILTVPTPTVCVGGPPDDALGLCVIGAPGMYLDRKIETEVVCF